MPATALLITLLICGVVVFAIAQRGGQTTSTADRPGTTAAAEFYAPVAAFERSAPAHLQRVVQRAKKADANRIDACQKPYANTLFSDLRVGGSPRYKLYMLYENGALLEQYQSGIAPVRSPLTELARAWSSLETSNPSLNRSAHGFAREFEADLQVPKLSSCAFVRAIAAHHFSYAWAKQSSFAHVIDPYIRKLDSGSQTSAPFWSYVYGKPFDAKHPHGPGGKLFTVNQLKQIANLPGESG